MIFAALVIARDGNGRPRQVDAVRIACNECCGNRSNVVRRIVWRRIFNPVQRRGFDTRQDRWIVHRGNHNVACDRVAWQRSVVVDLISQCSLRCVWRVVDIRVRDGSKCGGVVRQCVCPGQRQRSGIWIERASDIGSVDEDQLVFRLLVIPGDLDRGAGQVDAIGITGCQCRGHWRDIVEHVIRWRVFYPGQCARFNSRQDRRIIDWGDIDVTTDRIAQQRTVVRCLVGDGSFRCVRCVRSVGEGDRTQSGRVIRQRVRSGKRQLSCRSVPASRDIRSVHEDKQIFGALVISGDLNSRTRQNRTIRVSSDQGACDRCHVVQRIIRRRVFNPVQRISFDPQQDRRIVDGRNVDITAHDITGQRAIVGHLIADRPL